MYTCELLLVFLSIMIIIECKTLSCKGAECGMPLMDDLKAPLYVQLDTKSLNMQLKNYIDTHIEQEVEEIFENKSESWDRKLEQMKTDVMADLKDEMKTINAKLNKILNLKTEEQVHLPTRNTGDKVAKDCKDLNLTGDGVYFIRTKDYLASVKVYCETKTDGGGWTVIQRRFDGSVNFFNDWKEYENGFGNLNGEHWLGNKLIHAVTSQASYELRVDLEDWKGEKRYATYSTFHVGDSKSKYKLTINGYKGDAGDSLRYHNGQKFSTKDHDNDKDRRRNCAQRSAGGWWFKYCYQAYLNGLYNDTSTWKSITWNKWGGPKLKSTKMMIR